MTATHRSVQRRKCVAVAVPDGLHGAAGGLAIFEWLLMVAAAASVAAALAVTLQAAVDHQTDPVVPRQAHTLDAHIAAASIEHDARQAQQTDPAGYDETPYASRCVALAARFADVVASGVWRPGRSTDGSAVADLPRCEITLL